MPTSLKFDPSNTGTVRGAWLGIMMCTACSSTDLMCIPLIVPTDTTTSRLSETPLT